MTRTQAEPTSFATPRGTVAMSSPAPGVYHTVIRGHADLAIARRVVQAGDLVVAEAGFLVGFHDWEGMTGYETECRVILTEWGVRLGKQVERVHILLKSRIVAMGVSVASLVLGGTLQSYADRGAFEAAMAARVRKAMGA